MAVKRRYKIMPLDNNGTKADTWIEIEDFRLDVEDGVPRIEFQIANGSDHDDPAVVWLTTEEASELVAVLGTLLQTASEDERALAEGPDLAVVRELP